METEGNKPRARDKHQGVAVGTSIYYFGGFGPLTDEDVEVSLLLLCAGQCVISSRIHYNMHRKL